MPLCTPLKCLGFQGDLESRHGDENVEGKFVGDLHYTNAGVPVLIIGHHIIYGKVVDLAKPFVAMEKREKQQVRIL